MQLGPLPRIDRDVRFVWRDRVGVVHPGWNVLASVATGTCRKCEGNLMKVLIKSAWGSADPTQAAFPFHHANAFADAGHEVQIFLLGEAVSLMRAVVAASVVPVGWDGRPLRTPSRMSSIIGSRSMSEAALHEPSAEIATRP